MVPLNCWRSAIRAFVCYRSLPRIDGGLNDTPVSHPTSQWRRTKWTPTENQPIPFSYVEVNEQKRLNEARENQIPWKKWGPYLSERQWGTVREDYSEDGNAWAYFSHDQSRSRAYRWGEDGLAGYCDDKQQLCFCVALWNGRSA